jgi:hypothetical protein
MKKKPPINPHFVALVSPAESDTPPDQVQGIFRTPDPANVRHPKIQFNTNIK